MRSIVVLITFLITMLLSSSSCNVIKSCWLCEIWEGGNGYYITEVCNKSKNDIEYWMEMQQQDPNVEYISYSKK